MKYKIFAAFFAVLLLFQFSVYAQSEDYTINFDSSFTVGYTDKDLGEVAKITGMDKTALSDYCKQNGVSFVAVNKDNTEQMRLFIYQTELSKQAKDFNNLSSEALNELAKEIGIGDFVTEKSGGSEYMKFTETLEDSGGKYTSCQYITVKNGKVYQFSTYNSGETQSETVKKCFNSLIINSESSVFSVRQKIIIGAVISVLAAVIIIMIIGIIKDLKKQ